MQATHLFAQVSSTAPNELVLSTDVPSSIEEAMYFVRDTEHFITIDNIKHSIWQTRFC